MNPHLTQTPPVAGAFKTCPEDFVVEEIAKIEPDGHGDHCWLWIEKRGLTTSRATRDLAEALGADPKSAGWAGMKDRHALTRQWVSLVGVDPEAARAIQRDDLRVLDARKHGRKLKTGVLRGNRFILRIRDVPAQALSILGDALGVLVARGAPNYYGAQRFGVDNLARARRWLIEGGRAPRKRTERRFLVSALQSHAFNQVLAERIDAFDGARLGDVMRKEETGGMFVCTEPETDAPRVAAWEISPTGPMFGRKMTRADAGVGEDEARIERAVGFDDAVYARMGRLGEGTRRPLRVRANAAELAAADDGDGVILKLELPAGAYATVVLDELFKSGLRDASGPKSGPIRAEASE